MTSIDIVELTDKDVGIRRLNDLTRLLRDAVNDGATMGFLAPLSKDAADAYWRSLLERLATDVRLVLALDPSDRAIGTGQLLMPWQANGAHRAEVAKVIVASTHQRRGIGSAILNALERIAFREHRPLLVLNTRKGGGPIELYRRAGFVESGEIPGYTSDAAGSLQDTIIMYRWLDTRRF